jgi:hypothetical protein
MERPVVVFAGPFGSGKTETAINYALKWAEDGHSVTLVDLDVVTTYLRLREVAERLRERGLKVVTPSEAGDIDLPAITPQIWGALGGENGRVVVDLGGSAPGARSMGQFSSRLKKVGYAMNLVVNPYRPFTTTGEGIEKAGREIADSSRLQFTALVSNPHLLGETTLEVIEEGHLVVQEASSRLGLPIAFLCVRSDLVEELGEHYDVPILPLNRYLLAPWER